MFGHSESASLMKREDTLMILYCVVILDGYIIEDGANYCDLVCNLLRLNQLFKMLLDHMCLCLDTVYGPL